MLKTNIQIIDFQFKQRLRHWSNIVFDCSILLSWWEMDITWTVYEVRVYEAASLWCLAESDWKIGVLNTSTWTIKWSDRIAWAAREWKRQHERQKQWSPHKQNSKKKDYINKKRLWSLSTFAAPRALSFLLHRQVKYIRRKRLSKKYIFDVCEIAFKSDETKSEKKMSPQVYPFHRLPISNEILRFYYRIINIG